MAMLSIFATVVVLLVAGHVASFSESYKYIDVEAQGVAISIPDLTLRIWLGDPIEISHFTVIFFSLNRCLHRPPFIFGICPK